MNECKGFLSSRWKCGLCETNICNKCNENENEDENEHVCKPENVASMELLNKDTKIQRVESVGSQVGEELYANGALALLLVCFGIIAYLALRFEWRFAVAAIIANMHDVIIILGFFAFFQWEFNLTVLAAILAVLGYSVNESVVVFDRVRENFKKMRKANVVEVPIELAVFQ